MRKHLLIAFALTVPVLVRATTPDEKAEEIALAQPRVRSQYAALKAEAGRIKDPARRADLLGLLAHPEFKVVEKRVGAEQGILIALKAAGLIEASAQNLFPRGAPMAFIAGPGSVWKGHHSYPGGLVDHTLFNVRSGLALAGVYRKNYGIEVNDDFVRSAALMHDMAKTMTLHWNADGSLPPAESQVSGTGLHHILDVAEAITRGWPPDLVVCVASAHSPPHREEPLRNLINYLKAAALIAGAPNAAAGLNVEGSGLARPAPIEAFITHLDDHDSVFSEESIRAADAAWPDSKAPDHWARDESLARTSDIALYGRKTN